MLYLTSKESQMVISVKKNSQFNVCMLFNGCHIQTDSGNKTIISVTKHSAHQMLSLEVILT